MLLLLPTGQEAVLKTLCSPRMSALGYLYSTAAVVFFIYLCEGSRVEGLDFNIWKI